MSEKEMNSYRFTSGQEPTDEMLKQLMDEVAAEAAAGNQQAYEAYLAKMRCNVIIKQKKWAERINSAANGNKLS